MAQSSRDHRFAARKAIDRTMQRIELLVDRETEALRSRAAIDLKESNNNKSQALLELGLAARSLEGIELDSDLVGRLRMLRGKLEANQSMLRRHLEAVREIAGVVADTIQDSEWDGTYSQHAGSGSYYGGYR
ncbi:hypothetical protein [Hyphomicrobium sp. 1Nfss2.1]|uniref:hypothetical protein n=1 Tax=Hyphomicrobium sp. 1Nfss2.1 TaxID=3413936 RepID=UPI003C7D760C